MYDTYQNKSPSTIHQTYLIITTRSIFVRIPVNIQNTTNEYFHNMLENDPAPFLQSNMAQVLPMYNVHLWKVD